MTEADTAGAPAARDGHFVRSLAWVGGVRWASQVVSWVSTMLVFRALRPEETGLVAMATAFLGLVNLLNEFGISGMIIYARSIARHEIAQINGLSIMVGAGCFLLTVALSGPVASYYRAPDVQLVVVVLAVNFIVTSFQSVPLSVLRRELQFRSVALNDAIQAIVLAVVSVTLAYLGFGYWTLVIANLLGVAIKSAAAVWRRPCPFAWPRFAEIRPLLAFGSHMTISRLAWYVYSNADFWVVGRVLGKAAAGAYGLAWNLATMPVEKVSSVVMGVAPAFLSSIGRNPAEARRFLLLLVEGTALAALPATVGLAAIADVFVPLVLGPQWTEAVVPLQILAIYTTFRTITALLPPIMLSWGMARQSMIISVISALVLPAGFAIGIRWGLTGVALTWAILYPIVALPIYRLTFRALEMTAASFLRVVAPAAGFTVVMLAALAGSRLALRGSLSPTALLVLQIVLGAAVYGVCLRLGYWDRVRQLIRTVRSRPPQPGPATGHGS